MLPPAFSDSPGSIESTEYEELIQEGMIAVKNGNLGLAKRLLEQASQINSADPRIWLWLSATTDDPQERRDYLEQAVAADPSNATAKRGLMILTKKLDQKHLMPEGESFMPPAVPAPEEAVVKTYTCPQCGTTISYGIESGELVCPACGYSVQVDVRPDERSVENLVDETLPTPEAQRWNVSQTRVTCEQCGSVILLPPGQTSDICPYCGSNRFVSSSASMELEDPQVIGVFKIDLPKAGKNVKSWLSQGWLAPDNLAAQHGGMQLHPAYHPFWIFSGTVEIPWFCDVNTGGGKFARWEPRSGSHFENFDQILISGLRKMPQVDLAGIEPFNLEQLVEFTPELLAGWTAFTYDYPLADATLQAREKIVKKVSAELPNQVEITHSKRRFSIGAGKWSGLTYKLALLPVYIGNYTFRGQRFRVLVNGQTGKVSGKKPVDNLKIALFTAGGFLLLAILIIIFLLLRKYIAS